MKKYLIAILCSLAFTAAIGWAAESLDRYKEQLSQSRRIRSLELKATSLEERVKDLEDGLKSLHVRIEEMAIELRRKPQK